MRNNPNKRKPGKPDRVKSNEPQAQEIRLNRYIANAGICSRREADKLITEGKIQVNEKTITELGTKVKPGDKVTYQGKSLKSEKNVYVLLNKPKDFITTMDDPQGRRTVVELVKTAGPQRIYPVGRLDRMTTGLLILTNDGDLTKKLTHPSHRVPKIYHVYLNKPLTKVDFEQITTGITLDDGPVQVDKISIVSKDRTEIGLEIHIGKNRIVRRIFEHFGYKVDKLDRVGYAGLTKKDLPRGKWRFLSEKEIIRLKHFNR